MGEDKNKLFLTSTLCLWCQGKLLIAVVPVPWTDCSVMTTIIAPQLLLKDVDSLLYVDTDILFLQPVEEIWNFLSQFNSSQLAGMAPEHEEPRIGWYNRFARHPYYGKTGVNSGVMLMNMTRIRATHFKVWRASAHLMYKFVLFASEGWN